MWQRRLVSLSYQGTAYYGFSVSPSKPTIKEALYDRILTLLPRGSSKADLGFQYSSRTDSGVHAFDQKCSFFLPEYFSDQKGMNLINERLPGDIRIESMVSVDPDFNLRDCILGKDYYYWISFQPRQPFFSSLRWAVPDHFDLPSARKYMSLLAGEHDFSYFAKNQKQYKSTFCTLYRTEIQWLENNQWLIQIRGNRFLHHMIRFITGFLFAWLKTGKPIPDAYEDLFGLTCQASSLLAPAEGLYLVKTWLNNESGAPDWYQSPFPLFPLVTQR